MRQRDNEIPGVSPPHRLIVNSFCIATLSLALACCGRPAQHLSAGELAQLRPADTHTAALYDHSCKACHAMPGTGAPLVHDHASWDPRWAKGLDTLTSHAVLGFQAMPAGGQCAACTQKDYQAIIRFMADQEATQ
jgi:cytochrome c5